jgi:hypothetical protein
MRETFWIHGNNGAIPHRHGIPILRSSEVHRVLEAGASALLHGKAQAGGSFFKGQFPQVLRRRLGNLDHDDVILLESVLKSTGGGARAVYFFIIHH